ncbi:nuclear transport factor 2 family protein [Nocardia sp. NPDC049149]|uniref:nuclear transport factor 2 family protein n=1 Tax=Nocardia sp. NPDC049149 TaxID=3364315 RepID=UPI0037231B5A
MGLSVLPEGRSMFQDSTPVRVAIEFVNAWARRDICTVAAMLSDDVTFESPCARVSGITATLRLLGDFARVVTDIEVIAAFGDDHQAMILYDMATEAYGTVRVADRLVVRRGQIIADSVVFDTATMRPVPADIVA